MAAQLETRTIPLTATFLVEDILRASRLIPVTKQRWFMQEARAGVKQTVLVVRSEDSSRGVIIQ